MYGAKLNLGCQNLKLLLIIVATQNIFYSHSLDICRNEDKIQPFFGQDCEPGEYQG